MSAKPLPQDDDAHVLLPDWLADEVPPLYATEGAADPLVHAHYFTPDSSWDWYVVEVDRAEAVMAC
jgi:hypothetical protein